MSGQQQRPPCLEGWIWNAQPLAGSGLVSSVLSPALAGEVCRSVWSQGGRLAGHTNAVRDSYRRTESEGEEPQHSLNLMLGAGDTAGRSQKLAGNFTQDVAFCCCYFLFVVVLVF